MSDMEDKVKEPRDIPITARFDQYRSPFWAAALAGISIRYFPRPILKEYLWEKHADASPYKKQAYSIFAGLVMEAIAGFYAKRTYGDMKTIFAQSLAWELDKNKDDITYADFKKSHNTIIRQTMDNFGKYNVRRALVESVYFLPMALLPFVKNKMVAKILGSPETGVDLGVGANALYLLRDVLKRKITPFEELQALIDRKINQSDHFADQITAQDLLDIYERHAQHGTVTSFLPQRGTTKWQESMKIFERMADLINQTHKNVVPHEQADFSFPKFIFLMGNGMIDPDHAERSEVYIEVANKHGIGALKRAVFEISHGATLDQIKEEFQITEKELASQRIETPDFRVGSPTISPSNQENFKVLENKDKSTLAFQERLQGQESGHYGISA